MAAEKMTIYDIAKEAGVSASSVSRVINQSGYVAQEKKEKILEVIEKYKYVPNALAQGLSNKQSKTIGMLVPDVINPFFATMYVKIEEEAMRQGYNVILCNYNNQNATTLKHLEMLQQKQVDVIIQAGGPTDEKHMPEDMRKAFGELSQMIPMVTLGENTDLDGLSVCIDDSSAMKEMLYELYESGHRSFALIGGNADTTPTAKKQKVFDKVMKEIKNVNGRIVANNSYDQNGGIWGVRDLLKSEKLPTVMIGINEFVAMGIIKELNANGYSVPKDVTVVGFDNTYLSDFIMPPLSGIGCDYEKYAKEVVNLVLAAIQRKVKKKKVKIPSTYVRRASCMSIDTEEGSK